MHTNQENTPIKHTPSPWRAETSGIIFDAGGNEVAHVIRTRDLPLIAAAPELLAALKESHSLWENLLYHLEEMGVAEAALQVKGTAINMETFAAMLGNTKAAIAKAEGK